MGYFYDNALVTASIERVVQILQAQGAEGMRHVHAVLALARQRVNVLWALLREDHCYEPARCLDTPVGAYP